MTWVYVVHCTYYNECEGIEGVFSDRERAEAVAEKHATARVEQFYLDAEPGQLVPL